MITSDVRTELDSLEEASRRRLVALETQVERDWPELRHVRVLPWSDEPFLALDRGRPWLIGPIERDPLAQNGRTVLPGKQLRQLKDLAELDLPFQRLAIAHELDPEGKARALMPLLAGGPRTCTDEVARDLVGPLPAHPRLTRVAQTIGALAGAARSTATAGLDLLLDPIIFGVVAPSWPVHGEPGLWYPLVAWRW
jgi:hypothetical protein